MCHDLDIHEFLNVSGGKDNNSNGLSEVCTNTTTLYRCT